MTSAPDVSKSAAAEAAVTLPTPKQTWLGAFTNRVLGPNSRKGVDSKKPAEPLPPPTKARLEESWAESSFKSSSILPPTVLYLAYGSNLCYETFQGRRGIRPISAVNVVVPELSLVFDFPGFPYIEPCFANSAYRKNTDTSDASVNAEKCDATQPLLVSKDSSVALVGVVYEVTGEDYHKIIATEGPAYSDAVVECHEIPQSQTSDSAQPKPKTFQAHTLLAPTSALRKSHSSGPAQPSLRYLSLCRTGAAEHNLPASWQSYLNGLQHYHTNSIRTTIGKGLFILVWAPLVMLSFGVRRALGGKDGNGSRAAKVVAQSIFALMWVSYDYFFKQVFGDGERTPSQ